MCKGAIWASFRTQQSGKRKRTKINQRNDKIMLYMNASKFIPNS